MKKTQKLLNTKTLEESKELAKSLDEYYSRLVKTSLKEVLEEENIEKHRYLVAKNLAIHKMHNAVFTLMLTRRRSKKQLTDLAVAIDELDYYDLVI